MREYESLKHGRVKLTHELSFEHNRVLEGKPGERHSLAPEPETFLSRLRGHAKKMKRLIPTIKTRSRKYRD